MPKEKKETASLPRQLLRSPLRRLNTLAHHRLRFHRLFGPLFIQLSRERLLGEIAKQVRLLRVGMSVAVLRHGHALDIRLHPEIAALFLEIVLMNLGSGFGSHDGQDEIVHLNIASGAAEVRPLLVLSHKRTVKRAGRASRENEFTGKLSNHSFTRRFSG